MLVDVQDTLVSYCEPPVLHIQFGSLQTGFSTTSVKRRLVWRRQDFGWGVVVGMLFFCFCTTFLPSRQCWSTHFFSSFLQHLRLVYTHTHTGTPRSDALLRGTTTVGVLATAVAAASVVALGGAVVMNSFGGGFSHGCPLYGVQLDTQRKPRHDGPTAYGTVFAHKFQRRPGFSGRLVPFFPRSSQTHTARSEGILFLRHHWPFHNLSRIAAAAIHDD